MRDSSDAGVLHPGAPPETAQFEQLVGEWEARQVSRRGDGSWSEDTTTASWIWRYTPNGHAIQDDWIVPTVSDSGSARFRGMNIRIYDPEEQIWHIAWVDNRGRKVSVFTARGDSTRIVMTGVDARGRPSHNIFSEITPTSFLWTKEWTFDEGKSQVVVSLIRCVRKG
jgi:hypothetical protein